MQKTFTRIKNFHVEIKKFYDYYYIMVAFSYNGGKSFTDLADSSTTYFARNLTKTNYSSMEEAYPDFQIYVSEIEKWYANK